MRTLCLAMVLACPVGLSGTASATDAGTAKAASLLAGFEQAWDMADGPAIARLFLPDADLIAVNGLRLRGQTAIGAYYAAAFAHGYRGSIAGGQVYAVRVLAPDLFLVDATWSITGAAAPLGKKPSRVQGILAAIMHCAGHDCRIAAYRESAGATRIVEEDSARHDGR